MNTNLGDALNSIGMNHSELKEWELRNSQTPYILEETPIRATQIDIFSRLMKDRIIWINGPIYDEMASVIQAQLMYLDRAGDTDIQMYIDTPGGSVKAGLGIVDVMNYIACDVQTMNVGMAASMGSILLGAGTKGKRFGLEHSKVMLHKVSGGYQGVFDDMEINFAETKKYNEELFRLLSSYTGHPVKKILKDASRDFWLTPEEAKEYGIIDDIITKRVKK